MRSFLLLSLLIPTVALAESREWLVQPGDALSIIAERTGVSMDDLRRWNDISGDRIFAGQTLVIVPPPHEEPEDEPATPTVATNVATATRPAAPARPSTPPSPPPAREATPAVRRDLPIHTVRRGQTLSHIASFWGVTLPALRAVNPGVTRLREGQEIGIPVPDNANRIEVTVRPRESLSQIASRFRVRPRQILRWNSLTRSGLQAGQRLLVWSDVPPSYSESIGSPAHGTLRNASRLRAHSAYVIRDPLRAFGTEETALWLEDGFERMSSVDRSAPKLRVHDISRENGGPLAGHRSHQSGRDVDVSLYQTRCPGGVCAMRNLTPAELDAPRMMALFETWLKAGRIEAIFLDYSLQETLYNAARSRGATRAQLSDWFQYPRGATHPAGRIRHFASHRDHAHIRFVCPETDRECH